MVRLQQRRLPDAQTAFARALAIRPGAVVTLRCAAIARGERIPRDSTDAYAAWIAGVEGRRDLERAPLRAAVAARADATRFSILLPVFDTPEPWLRACLDSVIGQSYPHWELCVVDDASRERRVGEVLREYAARDPRIRVRTRERNGHICAASNDALALAGAPYVALLDHDDQLVTSALAEMALAIEERPRSAILYSDEDKIDDQGRRVEPYFKPDWNPALLASQNYVSHLGVYRTGLAREVGGFRPGTEGAQDWDLLLRCTERVDAAAIVHVPQVLYHWRLSIASTSSAMNAKPYAARAQERAVGGHFERRGIAVRLGRVCDGNFLQADPRPAVPPSVGVVVLGRADDADRVAGSWRSVAGVVGVAAVAIGAAVDDARDAALRLGAGDAAAINAAAARLRADVLLFVRSSAMPFDAQVVGTLAAHASSPGAGPVGGAFRDAYGMLAGGPLILDEERIAARAFPSDPVPVLVAGAREQLVQNLSAVRGDAMAVSRSLWDRLGGYDAGALARRFHDVDFCLRASEAGARTLWHPAAAFRVPEPVIVPMDPVEDDDDARTMRARWRERLRADPAYPIEFARAPAVFEFRGVARSTGDDPGPGGPR
ncbi:MAG: glycosyltransferase [Burkholderiales bacterium]